MTILCHRHRDLETDLTTLLGLIRALEGQIIDLKARLSHVEVEASKLSAPAAEQRR